MSQYLGGMKRLLWLCLKVFFLNMSAFHVKVKNSNFSSRQIIFFFSNLLRNWFCWVQMTEDAKEEGCDAWCYIDDTLIPLLWNVNKRYANTHTHTHTHTHTPCISNMWSYLLVFCHTPTFIFSQFPYQIRPNKTLRILEIYSLFHIHKKHERASKSRWWFFSSRRYQNP